MSSWALFKNSGAMAWGHCCHPLDTTDRGLQPQFLYRCWIGLGTKSGEGFYVPPTPSYAPGVCLVLWASDHKAVLPSSQDELAIALQYFVLPTNSPGLTVTSRLLSLYICLNLVLTWLYLPVRHC